MLLIVYRPGSIVILSLFWALMIFSSSDVEISLRLSSSLALNSMLSVAFSFADTQLKEIKTITDNNKIEMHFVFMFSPP